MKFKCGDKIRVRNPEDKKVTGTGEILEIDKWGKCLVKFAHNTFVWFVPNMLEILEIKETI